MEAVDFAQAKQKMQQDGFFAELEALQNKWGVQELSVDSTAEKLGAAILVKPTLKVVLDENWVLPDPDEGTKAKK